MAGRLVGAIIFLLAVSALWPLPFASIVPGIVMVLIAIAYLQEDGLLLLIGAAAAAVSLMVFGWTAWSSAGAVMKWIT